MTALVLQLNPQVPGEVDALINKALEKKGAFIRDGLLVCLPLWRAAETGDVEAVKACLISGINPNEKEEG